MLVCVCVLVDVCGCVGVGVGVGVHVSNECTCTSNYCIQHVKVILFECWLFIIWWSSQNLDVEIFQRKGSQKSY